MRTLQTKLAVTAATAFIVGSTALNAGVASAKEHHSELDKSVMATLTQCQEVSTSCAATTKDAMGILVFPDVVKADLIIGGAGGKGALIEDGKITGYYDIGAGSAGLQAGIENASQVYVFHNAEALDQLKKGPDWKVGATAGVTVVAPDTSANASSSTDNVLVYVFNSKGLNAGISLDVFDVWKAGHKRPSQS